MLLYPLTRGRELGWPVWGYVSMAGALVVFAVLVAYERAKGARDGSPLIELSLFRVKSFAAGIAVQTVFGVGLGVFFLVWTLYMQIGLGWSALRAGLTGVPFSVAVSVAAGVSVQQLVPRFGRKVLQAGALVMAAGVLIYLAEAERYGLAISSWQMALPLVVMGVGMGLIVAPLTDAVLSEVPREHAGSASGLINTVQQMGNALGLGLVSVVFFGVIDEPPRARRAVGPAFVDGFQHALGWVAAVLGVIFLLMFALPRRPAQHVEGGGADARRRRGSRRWSGGGEGPRGCVGTAGGSLRAERAGVPARGCRATPLRHPPTHARSCLNESECFRLLFTFRTTGRSLPEKPQVRAQVGGERSCTHRSGSRRSSGSPGTVAAWTWCRWPRSSR
ncbi:Putative multidrug resistance protein MdtD [Streptomyces tendae]